MIDLRSVYIVVPVFEIGVFTFSETRLHIFGLSISFVVDIDHDTNKPVKFGKVGLVITIPHISIFTFIIIIKNAELLNTVEIFDFDFYNWHQHCLFEDID